MARVPITVMGFKCERCEHEWVPRGGAEDEPKVCPKCRSPWWTQPPKKKSMMTYEAFSKQVADVLTVAGTPLTWTEIRTTGNLPQAFPNNQWVHRMEKGIGLIRRRESDGTIRWQLASKELSLGKHRIKTA